MLFTEENLKNFKITKNGTFRNINGVGPSYHYHYACNDCGYPFLYPNKNGKYCSCKCGRTGENNWNFGKTGELNPMFGRTGELNPMFGNGHLVSGELHPGWKNGVTAKNIPLYDTYAPQLEPYEKCVRDPEDPNILNVFCTNSGCKKQYRPTRKEVCHRIKGINKDTHRFYCSDGCKQVCPLFHQSAQSLMERDAENAGRITKLNIEHLRINQAANKKRRYEENGGICDRCEKLVTLSTSILHHEKPISDNFIMVDDPDNHWLFCIPCDRTTHQLDGCTYNELRLRRVCKTTLDEDEGNGLPYPFPSVISH